MLAAGRQGEHEFHPPGVVERIEGGDLLAERQAFGEMAVGLGRVAGATGKHPQPVGGRPRRDLEVDVSPVEVHEPAESGQGPLEELLGTGVVAEADEDVAVVAARFGKLERCLDVSGVVGEDLLALGDAFVVMGERGGGVTGEETDLPEDVVGLGERLLERLDLRRHRHELLPQRHDLLEEGERLARFSLLEERQRHVLVGFGEHVEGLFGGLAPDGAGRFVMEGLADRQCLPVARQGSIDVALELLPHVADVAEDDGEVGLGGVVVGVLGGTPSGDVERLLELAHGIVGVAELPEDVRHPHVGAEHRGLDARRSLGLLGDLLQPLHGGLEEIPLDLLGAGGLVELRLHLVDQDLHRFQGEAGLIGGQLFVLLGPLFRRFRQFPGVDGILPLDFLEIPLLGDRQGRHRRRHGDENEEPGDGGEEAGHLRVAPAPAPRPLGRGDRAGEDRLSGDEAAAILGEEIRRGVALGGLLLEAFQADRLDVHRELAHQSRRRDRLLLDHLHDGVKGARAEERRPADEHLVEHRPERIDVGGGAEVLQFPPRLLRRHVARRPHDRAVFCLARIPLELLGQPEVGDLRHPVGGEEDVGRLEIAVEDAVVVSELHRP